MFEIIIVLIISSFALLLLWWKSSRKRLRAEASESYTCEICGKRDCNCLRDFKKNYQNSDR